MYSLTITVTLEEWQDRARWHDILASARKQLHEVPQRVIIIRLGRRNGPELWKGVNHCKR